MFDSDHDFDILLVAAGCSTAAFGAALLVGGSILRSLDRVRGASSAIARGDLGARARGRAVRAGRARRLLQRDGGQRRGALRRAHAARRVASHDLRTPLALMQAMLEAVEDGLVEPEHYVPELQQPR